MADLNGLFQNLGPTGGALMSGLQLGQDIVSAQQQDEMRKAQMDEILQRTAAQKELAPLELQAKQQAIAAADLKAKEDRAAYTMDVLGSAIPQLKSIKGPQRFAEYERIFNKAGIPLDEADRAHMYAQNPDTFVSELESRHRAYRTSRPAYQQAVDVANINASSHERIAASQEAARAKREKDKVDRMATYEAQLAAAKGDANKAAVARQWAMKTDDAYERAELERQAKVYDAAAMERNPAKIKADADQAAMDRLTGKQRPLGPVKDLSVTDMRNAL